MGGDLQSSLTPVHCRRTEQPECDQQPLATNEQGVSYPSQVTESRWSLVACAMAGETHLSLHLPARRHQHYARSMSVDMHAGSDATFFRVVDEPLFDCGRTLVRSLAQSVPSLKTRCRRGPLRNLMSLFPPPVAAVGSRWHISRVV